jgi:hypothetical protein
MKRKIIIFLPLHWGKSQQLGKVQITLRTLRVDGERKQKVVVRPPPALLAPNAVAELALEEARHDGRKVVGATRHDLLVRGVVEAARAAALGQGVVVFREVLANLLLQGFKLGLDEVVLFLQLRVHLGQALVLGGQVFEDALGKGL